MSKTLPFIPVPFMTVIPGRRPEQKVHKRLSDAKNAFDTPKYNPINFTRPDDGDIDRLAYTHGWGQLYEFKDGEWQLHTEVRQPTVDDVYLRYARPWGNSYAAETRPWRLDK